VCLDVQPCVWTCSRVFGRAAVCLDVQPCVRTCSRVFGRAAVYVLPEVGPEAEEIVVVVKTLWSVRLKKQLSVWYRALATVNLEIVTFR